MSKNRSKIGDFAPPRSVGPTISGRGGHPLLIIFARIVRPMKSYNSVAHSFRTQKNFVADFLQAKCDLHENRPFCVFDPPPFWGFSGNVR